MVDQAEGLRRLLGAPARRITSVVAARPGEGARTVSANLAQLWVAAGREVIVLELGGGSRSLLPWLNHTPRAHLGEAVRCSARLAGTLAEAGAGLRYAWLPEPMLSSGREASARLLGRLEALAEECDELIVAAPAGVALACPLAFPHGERLLVTLAAPESLTAAYALLKGLHASRGAEPARVVVNRAGAGAAGAAFRSLRAAAGRFLGAPLGFADALPEDPRVVAAADLGRTVVDAFPRSPAAGALRRLAALPLPACLGV